MGITIEEIIEELESTKDYPASDPASDEALDGTINTMRKYQKIDQIISDYINDDSVGMSDYWMGRIKEVVEE